MISDMVKLSGSESELPVLRVDAKDRKALPSMRELYLFREMLYILVLRDIKVRYKQTVLGALWAILQPFLTMIVFTIFFGEVANIPSDEIPYPIFTYSALVPWTFFANGVALGSNSIVGQAYLIRKIYFPRLIIPLSRILGGAVDFVLALAVLILMMLIYGYFPSLKAIVFIPLLSFMTLIVSLSVSLWLSALNVNYRDVNYVVPFLIQLWMFSTPVVYPSSLLDDTARMLYGLNPMVTVIEGFRWALLDSAGPPLLAVAASVLVTTVLFFGGLYFFHRAEGTFSDIV